jgi:hypothetical protein
MQAEKISCAQCLQHSDCPHKTRLYINYCGADQKKMTFNIKTAITECRARRGHLFGRASMQHSSVPQVINAVTLSLST